MSVNIDISPMCCHVVYDAIVPQKQKINKLIDIKN